MIKRSLLFVATLIVAMVITVSLAQTLVYGLSGTFDELDPSATTFTIVGKITINVVEPLVWEVGPGKFEPGLATSWSVNDNATEYTFTLRQGVKFQDGTPFNAEAVKFTFDRIVNPATKSQTAFSLIGPYKETEILGPYKVKVTFSKPYAPFLDAAASPYLGIISPTAYKKAGSDNWGVTSLVGTGPFMLQKYVPDHEVVLVRNPNYDWAPSFFGVNGPAKIQKIDYKIISEPSTRTASLQTGETDFIGKVSPGDYAFLAGKPNIVGVEEPQPGSGWSLMMNVERSPTDELAVRRAIQLGSDKKGMIQAIWNGIGKPSCSPLTYATFGFDKATCDLYSYNPEKAKEVLEKAGWVEPEDGGTRVAKGVSGVKDGTPLVLDLYYQANSAPSPQMAAFIKPDLAKIGIDVHLHGLSQSGYFNAVRTGKHNLQFWWETFTDPSGLAILFASKNAHGGTNRNNYVNPKMDQLLVQAAGTSGSSKRLQLYSQIQKLVKDQAIMVFYNDPMTLYAYSKKLTNPYLYLYGLYPDFYPATISR